MKIAISGKILMIILAGIFTGFIFGQELSVNFDRRYGQIEIGGKYVGAEFHHSRPVPSRISFYYPVANSIDLSTDYWQRDRSLPLIVTVTREGSTDSISHWSLPYQYTPGEATFYQIGDIYNFRIKYQFCEDLPVMAVTFLLQNASDQSRQFVIESEHAILLRTCHSYLFRTATGTTIDGDYRSCLAYFHYRDTDSAVVFITNAGEMPDTAARQIVSNDQNEKVVFRYLKTLSPAENLEIIWLMGTLRSGEENQISETILKDWKDEVKKNRDKTEHYAMNQTRFTVDDPQIEQTERWSKAMLRTNAHYLDGKILPMPCPAEYNFFFTHDALLTNLGAVHFDVERVKNDLLFLKSLTREDSILPHAYYWKDGEYVTEFCGTDNWNHFWFIILANSYLKHSGDMTTIQQLYPIFLKSIRSVLKNKGKDDLIYATRPDWWDIGNLYGARTYVTVLMIRALQDFAAISRQLELKNETSRYLQLADRMKESLVNTLWDEKTGYLMNMLDTQEVDTHYYSGSLVAVMYGILDHQRSLNLLKTAEEKLLDTRLGIRNAMPPDFHQLGELYQFQGMEMGEPYVYANGGIWPQGTIWYGLGLLETGQVEKSLATLKKYLTLEGIKNSPNGQASFYEYRHADQASAEYGKIDKPTFLWAGGLYLNYLYRLAGVRENAWNIWFSPNLPTSFTNLEFDLTMNGRISHVTTSGAGEYYQQITRDGKPAYSAVLTGLAYNINLVRGLPESPYLAEADFPILQVNYQEKQKRLEIQLEGTSGPESTLKIVSPTRLKKIRLNGKKVDLNLTEYQEKSVFIYVCSSQLPARVSHLHFYF